MDAMDSDMEPLKSKVPDTRTIGKYTSKNASLSLRKSLTKVVCDIMSAYCTRPRRLSQDLFRNHHFKRFHWKSQWMQAHLVLVERIRDVISHVAGRMGQNDEHMSAGRGKRSELVRLGLDEWSQSVATEFIFCLAQARRHLTWESKSTVDRQKPGNRSRNYTSVARSFSFSKIQMLPWSSQMFQISVTDKLKYSKLLCWSMSEFLLLMQFNVGREMWI